MAREFLDIDLLSVMIEGWCKYEGLRDAALRTRSTAASEEVRLSTCKISMVQHPRIDVMVGEQTVHSIDFAVSVVVDAATLNAVLRHGALVELTSGTCDVTVTFGTEYVSVSASRTFDPHLAVNLGQGIPLVDEVIELPEQRQAHPGVDAREPVSE